MRKEQEENATFICVISRSRERSIKEESIMVYEIDIKSKMVTLLLFLPFHQRREKERKAKSSLQGFITSCDENFSVFNVFINFHVHSLSA